ncbi:MAG TPA: hypothetical protein VF088_02640 [Pyrinomonadaceae bacterium]
MRHQIQRLAVAALAILLPLVVLYFRHQVVTAAGIEHFAQDPAATAAQSPTQTKITPTPIPTPESEESIRQRERLRRGIDVEQPRVYDDAMLQQMLEVAEARLAQLQLIDQNSIASRLGSVTGASQRISSFGLNVQGMPLPQVVTTNRGATGSTTQTDQTTGSNSSTQTVTTNGTTTTGTTNQSVLTTGTSGTTQTVSGLASQDVVTTRGQFGPPGATAPSPTTTLPSSGFSVSSSDILNEQVQLTAEINGLRLMLTGDLTGHFRRYAAMTKFKTTLGFPITIAPDPQYKDKVAVVEVEVERSRPRERSVADEPPLITALLPREKTYNVAAITDSSVSVGAGVATQILGVSGSWLRGHKTYYLVQDQDTVASTFQPTTPERIGFMWEFRPVLGQHYVRSGLKQTFVQLAFDAPPEADEGEIGKVYVRTYWRDYDRKLGIHKEIVPGSLHLAMPFEIPRYKLAIDPVLVAKNLEDIGDGQVLIRLPGRYLPGTYVRIGSKIINGLPELLHEQQSLQFVAPIGMLATTPVYLVAHDGTEVPLLLHGCGKSGGTTITYVPNGNPTITSKDTNSEIKIRFQKKLVTSTGTQYEAPEEQINGLVMVVAGRVFGFSELKRNGDELSVVIPSADLVANPELSLQKLFPARGCRPEPVDVGDFIPPSQTERLVMLEHNPRWTKFLLLGKGLDRMTVLSPDDPRPELYPVSSTADGTKMRLLVLTDAQLQSNKQILVQRSGKDEKPFLVSIPEIDPQIAPPKSKESISVGANEAIIEGDAMKQLEKVTFRGKNVDFDIIDDNSVRLKGLAALGATSAEMTQRFDFKFKGDAKPKKVEIVVVRAKFEVR